MKKIAVLTSRFPYPLDRGDKLRIFHQIRSLSILYEVSLYSVSREKVSDIDIRELKPYCKHIFVHELSLTEQFLGLIMSFVKKWPFQVGINYSSTFRKKIEADSSDSKYDSIYCQLIRMAPFCKNLKHYKVIDFMDAFGLSMKKRSEISAFLLRWIYKWESNLVINYEKKISGHFDNLIFITQQDADATIYEESERKKIKIVSNGLDLSYFTSRQNNFHSKYDVGFIGNLGYLPNIDAVKFLCNDIAREYHKIFNKPLSVFIGGARPSVEVLKLQNKNITVTSGFKDIRKAYDSFKILCAPIKSGTGQQNKVLEAIGMKIPVICSEEVKQTLDINGIVVASDVSDFAIKINELLINESRYDQVKLLAHQNMIEKYDWNISNKPLMELFD